MSATRSQLPSSITASMMPSQTWRIPSSMARTRTGVNPADTRRRRSTWAGASMSIIIGSAPWFGRIPPALEKVWGSFEMSLMSRCLVMPQIPLDSSK